MNDWNVLGILLIIVGTTTLAVNFTFDVFMGDRFLSSLFASMSAFTIVAGVIMGGAK